MGSLDVSNSPAQLLVNQVQGGNEKHEYWIGLNGSFVAHISNSTDEFPPSFIIILISVDW